MFNVILEDPFHIPRPIGGPPKLILSLQEPTRLGSWKNIWNKGSISSWFQER